MRQITPLHGRANVILRPDLHNALHGVLVGDGAIDTALFGKVRVSSPIHYQTPAPRDSFAFGEIAAMGLPSREGTGREHPGTKPGDIVGFDLYQTGHQIDAEPYYENADAFVTVPWKELLCRFTEGAELPFPLGQWIMMEVDPIMTRRLLFSSSGSELHVPGGTSRGIASNKGKGTKVKLAAGKVLQLGPEAEGYAWGVPPHTEPALALDDWAIHNPMDAVTIRYSKGRLLSFVRWDDLEQVVKGDGR